MSVVIRDASIIFPLPITRTDVPGEVTVPSELPKNTSRRAAPGRRAPVAQPPTASTRSPLCDPGRPIGHHRQAEAVEGVRYRPHRYGLPRCSA